MTLHLRYKGSTTVPVEVEGITPDTVGDKSLAKIERGDIYHGNVKVPLAEFFDATGDPSDQQIVWEGDLAGVHWIGAKMTAGRVRVVGSAGRHVGSEMKGGEIVVEGDVSDWVGGELHGGLIRVRGRAGHLAGAAYRGGTRGMTGGTLLIHGAAGNEVGHAMRRGLLAVGGGVADMAGFNMLAGTILVFGDSGIRHGAGMKRGTLGFFGPKRPELLPSFRHACRYRPEALQLVLRHLQRLEFAVSDELLRGTLDLYNGDLLEGGRGEILVRATE